MHGKHIAAFGEHLDDVHVGAQHDEVIEVFTTVSERVWMKKIIEKISLVDNLFGRKFFTVAKSFP